MITFKPQEFSFLCLSVESSYGPIFFGGGPIILKDKVVGRFKTSIGENYNIQVEVKALPQSKQRVR